MAFSVGSFLDGLNEDEKEFYQKIAEIIYEFSTLTNEQEIKVLKKIIKELRDI